MKKIMFFLLLIICKDGFAQLGTGGNPGSEYGCVIYPTLYPNYQNAFNSTIPRFFATNPIPIVDKTGTNSYTCGRLNHGFPGYPDDASIDSPDAGTCFVSGKTYGVLRKYKVPVCNAPLDENILFLIFGLAGFGFLFIRSIYSKLPKY